MANLRMFRIDRPNWATPLAQDVSEDFDRADLAAIVKQLDSVYEIVALAVQKYIDNTDDTDPFPQKQKLSGAFYIAGASFWRSVVSHDKNGFEKITESRFSVAAHCLEQANDCDYLGLEAHFLWDHERRKIVFRGDIDSSSI
jgi:hypothetical protein